MALYCSSVGSAHSVGRTVDGFSDGFELGAGLEDYALGRPYSIREGGKRRYTFVLQ